MRVTLLAPLAVMLLACQLPGAPEDDDRFDQPLSSSATTQIRGADVDGTVVEQSLGDDHTSSESEDHAGC